MENEPKEEDQEKSLVDEAIRSLEEIERGEATIGASALVGEKTRKKPHGKTENVAGMGIGAEASVVLPGSTPAPEEQAKLNEASLEPSVRSIVDNASKTGTTVPPVSAEPSREEEPLAEEKSKQEAPIAEVEPVPSVPLVVPVVPAAVIPMSPSPLTQTGNQSENAEEEMVEITAKDLMAEKELMEEVLKNLEEINMTVEDDAETSNVLSRVVSNMMGAEASIIEVSSTEGPCAVGVVTAVDRLGPEMEELHTVGYAGIVELNETSDDEVTEAGSVKDLHEKISPSDTTEKNEAIDCQVVAPLVLMEQDELTHSLVDVPPAITESEETYYQTEVPVATTEDEGFRSLVGLPTIKVEDQVVFVATGELPAAESDVTQSQADENSESSEGKDGEENIAPLPEVAAYAIHTQDDNALHSPSLPPIEMTEEKDMKPIEASSITNKEAEFIAVAPINLALTETREESNIPSAPSISDFSNRRFDISEFSLKTPDSLKGHDGSPPERNDESIVEEMRMQPQEPVVVTPAVVTPAVVTPVVENVASVDNQPAKVENESIKEEPTPVSNANREITMNASTMAGMIADASSEDGAMAMAAILESNCEGLCVTAPETLPPSDFTPIPPVKKRSILKRLFSKKARAKKSR